MIFGGKVLVHSTCQSCGDDMVVIQADDLTHPTCAGDTDPPSHGLRQGILSTILAGEHESQRLTAIELGSRVRRSLTASAVFYARKGWPVFPLRHAGGPCQAIDRKTGVQSEKCRVLCQCPKTPATRSGFKDASTDLAAIEKWWTAKPHSNIGLATGHLFDVIDIDVKDPEKDGIDSFTKLLAQERLPPIHGIAVTATGGLHLYIKPTGSTNKAGWVPGIDHRGIGGYVVGAPSTLDVSGGSTAGNSWQWIVPPSPHIMKGPAPWDS